MLSKAIFLALCLASSLGFAKEVIQGEPAKARYESLVQWNATHPGTVTTYTNMFFGDDRHPEYGRLWFTTIYQNAEPKTLCYQYDYRDAGVIEYLCELPDHAAVLQAPVQAGWSVSDGDFGKCESIEDIGHWGYTLAKVDAQLNESTVTFDILVVNLRCIQKLNKEEATPVQWGIAAPHPVPFEVGEPKTLVSVSGYISEADSFALAQFSAEKAPALFEKYSLPVVSTRLAAKLKDLKEGQTAEQTYRFGIRGMYEVGAEKTSAYSLSGRFDINVTWVKQNGRVKAVLAYQPSRK